eukprot:TRINITY_DN8742_c0_g1_i1.p1 TRINITY_DN8742_c0_g1~~TRINITY_DN8742_c0_g1_i1.p1  ORF type:complete len:327 (-),score=80.58 TRINITY_DN8742_c0_g1_i1:124-1104(-)
MAKKKTVDAMLFPEQTGKVVIVTGGSSGIGKETCKFFLAKGARVYMGARNRAKAEQVIEELKNETLKDDIHLLQMDLADLHSVKEAAETFKSQERSLHLLYNNAGIMGTPFALTKDGFEEQFGTNVIGHFVFTRLLLPVLERTASENPIGTVRIINVSSVAHSLAPCGGIRLDDITLQTSGERFLEWKRYGQSKLGNILFSNELAKRYADRGIYSVSLHPGVVDTPLQTSHAMVGTKLFKVINFLNSFQLISPPEGAYTQIYAGVSNDIVDKKLNGAYLVPFGRVERPNKPGNDSKLAEKLWEYLEGIFEEKVPANNEVNNNVIEL